jgi:hypothetical protein
MARSMIADASRGTSIHVRTLPLAPGPFPFPAPIAPEGRPPTLKSPQRPTQRKCHRHLTRPTSR